MHQLFGWTVSSPPSPVAKLLLKVLLPVTLTLDNKPYIAPAKTIKNGGAETLIELSRYTYVPYTLSLCIRSAVIRPRHLAPYHLLGVDQQAIQHPSYSKESPPHILGEYKAKGSERIFRLEWAFVSRSFQASETLIAERVLQFVCSLPQCWRSDWL